MIFSANCVKTFETLRDRGRTGKGNTMSLRLTVLNLFFRGFAKPHLRRTTDPALAKRAFAIAARLFLARAQGVRQVGVATTPRMRWITPLGGGNGKVILYFHGGGYLVGSPETHRGLAARLARETGCVVCLPAYRLVPEHPFPAAWDDADTVWDALMESGAAPHDIVLAGESAGGGLALSLLARLFAKGTPPAALVAFSPWTDLTGQSASLRTNATRDPLLPAEGFATLVGHVLAGHPADDPRASPLFAEFPGCPPVLFQVGESEILRDDTVTLATRLEAQGAEVTLALHADVPHAWQLLVGRLPEADRAVRQAGAFVRGVFGDDPAPITPSPRAPRGS
jgi:epsilon-lactone hydrolase